MKTDDTKYNELITLGVSVFGNEQQLSEWMKIPNQFLGDSAPGALITTESGMQSVVDELNRIARGDLA